MIPSLHRKYFAIWREVKDHLIAAHGMTAIEAEAMRDEYCIKAHGRAISAAHMTDDEAGDVLKEFALILQPDSIDAQLQDNSTDARKRAQCLWSINNEEKHPGTARSLSQDLYGRRDIENLPYDDLLQLRRRIGNDARDYQIPGGNSGRRRAAAARTAPALPRRPIGIDTAGKTITSDPF